VLGRQQQVVVVVQHDGQPRLQRAAAGAWRQQRAVAQLAQRLRHHRHTGLAQRRRAGWQLAEAHGGGGRLGQRGVAAIGRVGLAVGGLGGLGRLGGAGQTGAGQRQQQARAGGLPGRAQREAAARCHGTTMVSPGSRSAGKAASPRR